MSFRRPLQELRRLHRRGVGWSSRRFLPFKNLGAAEDEYFADGIADEITTKRAGLSGLAVISPQSVMRYKGTTRTTREIGKELDVQYLLQGRIRWQKARDGSSQVRVTPRLIQVADDRQLWAGDFDEVLEDVLRVQGQIALQVANALGVALLSREQAAVARLSIAHGGIRWGGLDPGRDDDHLAKQEEHAERALALDPGLPAGHAAMGWYHYWGHHDYQRAFQQFRIASAAEPNNSFFIMGEAVIYKRTGDFAAAAQRYARASGLDPLGQSAGEAGFSYILLRRYDKAEPYLQRFATSTRQYGSARVRQEGLGQSAELSLVYAKLGRKDDAVRAAQRHLERQRELKDVLMQTEATKDLADVYVAVGEYHAALAQLEWPPRVAPSAAHHRFHHRTVSETALAGTRRVEIADLKQQARLLEQQGNAGEALAMYRLILAELDAIGAIRQELPLLIKIGDLQLKSGDVDGAVDMYERAAGEYATQGVAQPVMSLCVKIVRADPQAVGAYLRLARKLLEAGQTDGARRVLMDYAQRAKLDKTREGLEKLAGHAEDNQKIVLTKAIEAAEERVPKRTPWAQRAAPAPASEEGGEEEGGEEDGEPPAQDEVSPPPEPSGPRKRLTVPVGALDAEPDPSLLEQRPPEPRPEVTPESLFPTAEDLQAPVIPQVPATPPLPTPVMPPLPAPSPEEPPRIDTLATMPPAPPPAPPVPLLRGSAELVIEPSFAPPSPSAPAPPPRTPAAEPRPEAPAAGRPSRPSRPQPRLSRVAVAAPRRPRRAPRWLWPLIGGVVIVGGVGALLWFRVIPLDRVRNLLPQRAPQPVEVGTPSRRPAEPRPDTVMARDTAGAEPVAATPRAPSVQRSRSALPPPPPPSLPPGVVLTGVVYVVLGLMVESVEEISPENRLGFRIAQVLDSGERIILEEFPADTTIEGEIGVTGLPGDTVVGHVRIGGVDVTLKGVIPETLAVELLQQLVQVRP